MLSPRRALQTRALPPNGCFLERYSEPCTSEQKLSRLGPRRAVNPMEEEPKVIVIYDTHEAYSNRLKGE